MKRPIYLDYSATTPVDPRVAETMMACLIREGNSAIPPRRSHVYGWQAEEAWRRRAARCGVSSIDRSTDVP